MGKTDELVHQSAAPLMRQDETISTVAQVKQPIKFNGLNIPTSYVRWLIAVTSQRLIIFPEKEMLAGNMDAEMYLSWEFKHIAEVNYGNLPGVMNIRLMNLVPYEGLGGFNGASTRFDFPRTAKGVDGQEQFHAGFPEWLQQQVAAGAFPMSQEERSAWEQERAAAQQQEREKQERARAKRKNRGPIGLLIGGIVFALAALTGLALTFYNLDQIVSYQDIARDAERYSQSSTYHEAERARHAGRAIHFRDKIRRMEAMVGVYGAVTFAVLGISVLFFVLFARKKKKAKIHQDADESDEPTEQPIYNNDCGEVSPL